MYAQTQCMGITSQHALAKPNLIIKSSAVMLSLLTNGCDAFGEHVYSFPVLLNYFCCFIKNHRVQMVHFTGKLGKSGDSSHRYSSGLD